MSVNTTRWVKMQLKSGETGLDGGKYNQMGDNATGVFGGLVELMQRVFRVLWSRCKGYSGFCGEDAKGLRGFVE